jgi:serine/threonine-protein kinase
MKKGEVVVCGLVSYSLIKSIGGGGSGDVWKAKSNNKYYAIKFLKLDKNENGKDKKKYNEKKIRFENELKFCKENPHKNICPVIAEGKHNGEPFYIMPLYEKTLKDVINETHKTKDADFFIKYILQLCIALKLAHKKNVIHRDIKPENILIDGRKLVLADFGIAHFKDSTLTKKGDLLANRNYLAPEQKLKGNALNIEKSADIYALGLVINECFTKQNPTGSSFKVIADDYPLYFKLDTLVENMIKQNPKERFTIEDVIVELKYIYATIKQDLRETRGFLLENGDYPDDIPISRLNNILKIASEDLLFAKYIFEYKTAEEIQKYNGNWHMKIGYKADRFLYNLYMQEMIFEMCLNKFNYESNGYSDKQVYTPLNLKDNEEHKQIYQEFKDIVAQYPLNYKYEKFFDLSGRILKFFSSCEDYHCTRLLENVRRYEFVENTKKNLFDNPILWIVKSLKNTIKVNIHSLTEGYESTFGAKYKFNLAEHILINWDRTIDYEINDDDLKLINDSYKEDEEQIKDILMEFQRQWKIIFNKIDEDYYSIKFKSYRQFEKFRKHVITISKSPVAVGAIEGDILDLIKHYKFANGIVEIELSKVFDIPRPLPIILGLKNDY